MLYEYTPEKVGGTIIYEMSWHGVDKQFRIGDHLIVIRQDEKNDMFLLLDYELTKTVRVISSVELDWRKHETDNYFYPVIK